MIHRLAALCILISGPVFAADNPDKSNLEMVNLFARIKEIDVFVPSIGLWSGLLIKGGGNEQSNC
jgi:hypothetical protein